METYLDNYGKYLIGNIDFFYDVVERLIEEPVVNRELIFQIQRRLKVLKVIENVSESLEEYFYGKTYLKILNDKNLDLEKFVKKLLKYDKKPINIKINKVCDRNLEKICSKSYEHIHNYNCSNNVQVNVNSNEIFLEDYDEIDELVYIAEEMESNINFKILDVINNEWVYENRIKGIESENYINTKITLLKIDNYIGFIVKENLDEFILNRMSLLDPNPIWKYYLLEIKLKNKELPHTIMSYASYIKDNFRDYYYIDEGFYKFIGVKALIIICETLLDVGNYETFDKYYEELKEIESNLLELMYLKAKKIINTTDILVGDFLKELEEEYKTNPNKSSALDGILEKVYKLTGQLFERSGDYISAAENYVKSGDLIEYANKLGQVVVNLNQGIYENNQYSQGIYFTSKINLDKQFISDNSHQFNIEDTTVNNYTRTFIFELCAKEIIEKGVVGEVAELGVFRGDFASLINEVFPNKKLYLFDTFESLDALDMEVEMQNNFMTRETLYEIFHELNNTSVDTVMEKMKNKGNVIVKKGYFPYTVDSLEEKFCFVSIDVDLYKPTLEGLKYFYDRLSPGGYIFVHGYNYKMYPGVYEAVKDFEKTLGHLLCKVPVSDFGGTLVITK